MLAQRVASAVVGLPLVILLIWAGGLWYTAAAVLVVLIAAYEFLTPQHGAWAPLAIFTAGLAAAIPAGAFVGTDWVLWFLLAGVVLPLVWVTLRGDPNTALPNYTHAIGGIAYVGLLGAHLVLLREFENGRDWVFLAIFSAFAVDTAAYVTGKAIGRRTLAPNISPGKTVEGTIGGLAGGFGFVLLANYLLGMRLEAALIVPLAALLPLAAILGDLAESMLKRGMQIKDAGKILPGHGGFLDRLDSVLFTVPVVYYFLICVVP